MDDRRCAAGVMCRSYTVENGKRVGVQLTTATGMCDTCQRWVRTSMKALPADWCKLKLTIGESRANVTGGQTRRPKPGSRVPLNVAADDLMRQIAAACDIAALLISEVTHAQWHFFGRPTGRGGDYRMIQRAVKLVAERVDTLIDQPGGINTALRITDLHRKVVRHLGETHQREHQHLPCPVCGAQALVKEVQDNRGRGYSDGVQTPEVIRCLACDGGPNRDGTWTEAEYEWLSTMVLTEREEINVLKWLLAEAQWQRDFALWLAAEREWALGWVDDALYSDLGLGSGLALLQRVQEIAVPA